ncbi:hypothetical protein [Streptosporangium roseum]|uniref:hypothetical protein n=1 Tax=Streptosporangium roseum TaxID=2001 RepID=UPI0012DC5480|nr:hypothetical protein [Streptosporangium roseum]
MRATPAWLERGEQVPPPMKAPKKVSPPYSPVRLGRLRGWAERLPCRYADCAPPGSSNC